MKSFDVAIIGAGVIGCACALEASLRGLSVALIDRRAPTAGTSGACDGYLSVSTKVPGLAMKLAAASQALYPDWIARIDRPVDYTARGGYLLVEDAADMPQVERHLAAVADAGITGEILEGPRMLERLPALSPDMHAIIHFPRELQVSPYELTLALAAAAERAGATRLFYRQPVGFSSGPAGIASVDLVDGEGGRQTLAAGQFVFAAGVWSQELGRLVGLDLPVVPRRGELIVTERLAPLADGFVVSARYLTAKVDPDLSRTSTDPLLRLGHGFTLETTGTGQHVIGSTRTFSGYDRSVSGEGLRTILREAILRVPALARVRVLRAFAGLRPFVADRKPLIGRSERVPNLLVATGHEGDGITMTPITATLIADLLQGRPPALDIGDLAPDRFTLAAAA